MTGDDKEHVSALRKANKKERRDPSQGVLAIEWSPASEAALLASGLHQIDVAEDDTAEQVAAKQVEYARLRALARVEKAKLIADAWCAAFVARKTPAHPPITDKTLRELQARTPDQLVNDISASRQNDGSDDAATAIDSIRRVADQYQFTHLHLAFPSVFKVPENLANATNDHTGWSGGFAAILSNPPWERVKLQEKEFFSQHDETIAAAPTAAARKRLIANLKASNPTLLKAFEQALRQAEGISARPSKLRLLPSRRTRRRQHLPCLRRANDQRHLTSRSRRHHRPNRHRHRQTPPSTSSDISWRTAGWSPSTTSRTARASSRQ